MQPRGAATSTPAPMAAATDSSISTARRAPEAMAASTAERRSTSVMEAGTLTATLGLSTLYAHTCRTKLRSIRSAY